MEKNFACGIALEIDGKMEKTENMKVFVKILNFDF
jgi:hypothetical protein